MEHSHHPHPWIAERQRQGPHLTQHEHLGFNGKIAVWVTRLVGTIWCAYVFAALAFVALPQAIEAGSLIVLVNWVSSNFLQLVLLPIIIVGQNILAKASDKQAEQTFKDAEAILELQDEIHRLIEINNDLTQAIHAVVVQTSNNKKD